MTDVKQLEKTIEYASKRDPIKWGSIGLEQAIVDELVKAARAQLEALKQEPVAYITMEGGELYIPGDQRVFCIATDEECILESLSDFELTGIDVVPVYAAPVPQEATPDDLHIAYQQGRADERAAQEKPLVKEVEG